MMMVMVMVVVVVTYCPTLRSSLYSPSTQIRSRSLAPAHCGSSQLQKLQADTHGPASNVLDSRLAPPDARLCLSTADAQFVISAPCPLSVV